MDLTGGTRGTGALRQARARMAELGRVYVDHVFISFSGGTDRLLARRLRRALRAVASRWLGRHKLRVFMDEPSLAPGSELQAQLLARLAGSARLVLIASPDSAKAPWVDVEVRHWLDNREATPVILAHSGGRLDWPNGATDFDWAKTDALDRAKFERVYTGVPLWVDITAARGRRFGGRKALRLGAAKIAASLLDVDPEALWRTEQRRRRSRGAIAVLAACAVVTAASLALVAQADSARQKAVATATQLLTVADRLRGMNDALAAQLDIASYQSHATPVAQTDLMNDEDIPMTAALPGTAAAFSPDGRLIVGFSGSSVVLWSAATLQQVGTLAVPSGTVSATAAFSPDSSLVAVGSWPGGAVTLYRVGDPAHPTELGRLPGSDTSQVSALAFTGGGARLVVAQRSGAVRLWPVPVLGSPATSFTLPASVYATRLSFSADGQTLRSEDNDGSVYAWQVTAAAGTAGAQLVPTGQGAVAVSGDGTAVTANLVEGNTFLWQPGIGQGSSGDAVAPLSPQHLDLGAAEKVAFSPNGLVLATTDPATGTLTLWNMGDPGDPIPLGPAITSPLNPALSSTTLLFSSDGTMLAWGSALLRLPAGYLADGGRGLGDKSSDMEPYASTGGNLLVIAGGALPPEVASLTSPPRLKTLPAAAGVFASVSPGGRFVLADDQGTIDRIRLWTVSPDLAFAEIPLGASLDTALGVTSVDQSAVSADGRYLALLTDDGVQVWDVADTAHPRRLSVSDVPAKPQLVSFGTGADELTVLGSNGEVNLLQPSSGGFAGYRFLSDPRLSSPALAVGDQGRVLAVPNGKDGATVWFLSQSHGQIGRTVAHAGSVSHVALSPDGSTLATGTDDGMVQLWDLRATGGAEIGHPLRSSVTTSDRFMIRRSEVNGVAALAFSADGSELAAANADGTVRVWDTDPRRAIARICAATVGAVTPDLWARSAPGVPYQQVCPNQWPGASPTGARSGTPSPPGTAAPSKPGDVSASASGPVGPCSAGALRMAFHNPPQATATNTPQGGTTLVLTNTSTSPCTLFGAPDVVLHGPDFVRPDGVDYGPDFHLRVYLSGNPPAITVPAKAQAHVDVEWATDTTTPGWTPQTLALVLPAGGGTLQLPWPAGVSVYRQDEASRPATFAGTFLQGGS